MDNFALGQAPGADYSCIRRIELICEYSGYVSGDYAMFDNIAVTEIAADGITKNTYDENTGDLISVTNGYSGTYYEYDDNHNVTRVANDNGELIEYTYDDKFRVIYEDHYTFKYNGTKYYPYWQTNVDSFITKTHKLRMGYQYDESGNVISEWIYDTQASKTLFSKNYSRI